ncbi:MAG TPA: phosphate ABC transporter substrate-binding/OmpA family protein, partial [Solimonas sp.]|nr:phosphate ABC transporter substrate-binding/OmpA family protein [Solimonas sp.]
QLRQRRGAWRVEAEGSEAALKLLQDRKAEVAVLWEPDVSRALADPQLVKLIGSEDTEHLIVDVLLASRRVLQSEPEAAEALLREYFETLHAYGAAPAQLQDDVAKATGLKDAQVSAMLGGVQWASLDDNGAHWFGVSPAGLPQGQGLIATINDTVTLLRQAGDFDHNPLPDQDPFRITQRQFIAGLYLPQGDATRADSLARPFKPLDDAGWGRLREVGTLKIEPIGFARGTATLDEESRDALNAIAERLRHYPNYRLLIRGHTGIEGDMQANLDLSTQRAQAAAGYFLDNFKVDAQRVRAIGYGGLRPLARLPDESERAWGYRLPRVEFALLGEGY